MLKRRRKIKKAMIRKNSTKVYNTTAIPETTAQHPNNENWYSYVDFLREEKVL